MPEITDPEVIKRLEQDLKGLNPYTQVTAQRQQDIAKVTEGALGEASSGVPLLGAMVPDYQARKDFRTNHPYYAAAARGAGSVAGSIPFFEAGPAAMAPVIGGALNFADTAVRGGTRDDALKSGAVGLATGAMGRAAPRAVSPGFTKPPLSDRMDRFASGVGTGGVTLGGAHLLGVPPGYAEATGLTGLIGIEKPWVNEWLTNQALKPGTQTPPPLHAIINALTRPRKDDEE